MVRRIIFAALALLALGGTTLFLWPVPMRAAGNPATLEGDTARGAYVARLGGCFACHTDTEGGGAIFAGGPPLRTPFGVFYAPNITMHETDGIGGWTIEDFDRAMRSGLSPKGTHYFPAFPYGYYTKMTDQDIADLWSAFQTVPPVASWRVIPNARPSGIADDTSRKDQAIAVHAIPPENAKRSWKGRVCGQRHCDCS